MFSITRGAMLDWTGAGLSFKLAPCAMLPGQRIRRKNERSSARVGCTEPGRFEHDGLMEILLILGVLIGLVMGLAGAGGGVLAVPALVIGLGWSMQQAAPVALIAVAGGAALGAFEGLRHGLVRYRAAFFMVVCGLPLTPVGIHCAHQWPQRYLQLVFAIVILIVASRLIRQTLSSSRTGAQSKLARIDPDTGRFRWTRTTGVLFAVIGAFAGFSSGLLGVGGGFFIVPALRRFTDVSMHGVVATSLMVIALVSSGSVTAALIEGATLPMPATLLFAGATALGMGLGRKLSPRLSEQTIQRGFAGVLLAASAQLMSRAW